MFGLLGNLGSLGDLGNRRSFSTPFNPLSNFDGGRKGAWWSFRTGVDGSQISTVEDLSPNNNDLSQPSSANRPLYSVVDGVGRAIFSTNDFMNLVGNAVLNIGSETSLTIIAAIRQTSSLNTQIICESGSPTDTFGGFSLFINNVTSGTFGSALGMNAATSYNFRNIVGIFTTPRSYVATVTFDTTLSPTLEMSIRIDGILQTTTSIAQSGSNSGNMPSGHVFTVGSRSGGSQYYLNSELFDLMILPGPISLSALEQTEEYIFNVCNF